MLSPSRYSLRADIYENSKGQTLQCKSRHHFECLNAIFLVWNSWFKKTLAQSTGRCVEYGIDYSGYDLEVVTGIQYWLDSAYQCRDHRSYSYWSWSTTSHKCYLRSSDSGRHHVGQVMAGSYTCLSECEEWRINPDFKFFYSISININLFVISLSS